MRPIRRSLTGPLALVAVLAVGATPALAGEIALENRDGLPYEDHLTFNRFANNGSYAIHDLATVRVRNDGATALQVTGLGVTGRFRLEDSIPLPRSIPAGGFLDVRVRYTANTAGSPNPNRHSGVLTIRSNDADEPTTRVALEGVWSVKPQGGNEPPLAAMVDAFGYDTVVVASGQSLKDKSRVRARGEEVLSKYWRVADPARPVTVRQLVSSHGNISAAFQWHEAGSTALNTIFQHDAVDQQAILPRILGLGGPAQGGFSPPSPGTLFGFRSISAYSDDTRNIFPENCTDLGPSVECGHFMRFYPLRERGGAIRPNAYLVAMDIAISNYDYNDNVYLVENVQPAGSVPDTAGPTLTSQSPAPGAVDVPVSQIVDLRFNEILLGSTITDSSVQLLRGSTPVAATRTVSSSNTRIRLDPVADLAPGTLYTVRIGSAVTDNSGNPVAGTPVTWSFTTAGSAPPPPPPAETAYQFVGGQVVMEAENADEVVARSGKSWQPVAPSGAVGGAMAALSDSGQSFQTANAPSTAPELRFRVGFPAAGTYRVSLRGNAPNTAGNSVHVGLNGALTTSSDAISFGGYGTWGWAANSDGGPKPARITVPSAGVHTVNVWDREDGMVLDRVVIAPLGAATPTGTGPAESPRA
jgi:hypothetical protein